MSGGEQKRKQTNRRTAESRIAEPQNRIHKQQHQNKQPIAGQIINSSTRTNSRSQIAKRLQISDPQREGRSNSSRTKRILTRNKRHLNNRHSNQTSVSNNSNNNRTQQHSRTQQWPTADTQRDRGTKVQRPDADTQNQCQRRRKQPKGLHETKTAIRRTPHIQGRSRARREEVRNAVVPQPAAGGSGGERLEEQVLRQPHAHTWFPEAAAVKSVVLELIVFEAQKSFRSSGRR